MVFFILDSGSDWSRGIYLTQSQGFDSASEGRGEEGENSTDSFPKKIKVLKDRYLLVKFSQCGFYIEHSSLIRNLCSKIPSEERIAELEETLASI